MHALVRKPLSVCVSLLVAVISLIFTLIITAKHRVIFWLCNQPGDLLATGVDVLYLAPLDCGGSPVYICWMVELDDPVDPERLQYHLMTKCSENSARLKKFRRVPVQTCGTWMWRRAERFQIENHVKPYPEVAEDHDHVKRILGRCCDQRLPTDLPPWVIHVIQLAGGGTVLFSLTNHAIADGDGSNNLLNQLIVDSPAPLPQRKTKKLGALERSWIFATNLLDVVASTTFQKRPFMEQMADVTRTRTAIDWTRAIPLSEISRIQTTLSPATVNDIACAVVWEALCRYVRLTGTPAPDSNIISTPMSLREHGDSELDNKFAPIGVSVSFTDPSTLVDKIKSINEQISRKKRADAVVGYHLLLLVSSVFSLNTRYFFTKSRVSDSPVAVNASNMAAPLTAVTLMGANVKHMMFLPAQGVKSGLSITISSYNGELRITINDKLEVIDTARYIELVEEVFGELLARDQ